jgi:hypothetical protein
MDVDELSDEDDADVPQPGTGPAPARRFPLALPSQRALQIVLGLFWVLDAALQFQPFMFGRGFVQANILANAQGQPFVIGDLITHIGNFLAPDIAVWNTFFALIQLAIGLGLLYRPTVRPALAVSFAWALGVWFFGEGLGMVFTGAATALTGAPGSVLVYGLLGLMAWPRAARAGAGEGAGDGDGDAELTGVASSAAAQGIGRSVTPLAVWAGFWSLAAVLFLFPDNRTPSSVSSAVVGMAQGEPSWYGHFLNSLGHQFSTSGTQTSWILALVSVVIGLGPLVARRAEWFLGAGGLLSLVLWVSGQGLLGNVFSGSDTDPNTGPLVILLALAMMPLVVVTAAEWRSPAATVVRRVPALATLGVAALGAALALSATYPAAPSESASMAMSGMDMDSVASSSQAISSDTCHPNQTGLKISGLDLANTPYMIMSGTNGMDMNGADASAAAGFNVTKPNWTYTGPALPQAEANMLLADGNNGPADIHMALSGCAARLTSAEDIGAEQYVQQTSAAAGQYSTPAKAEAAGYQPASPTGYPVVYYVNPQIVAANAAAKRTLDPAAVDGLLYAVTPSETEVLAAAFYILPSTVTTVPMPYGALVQWHRRVAVCGDGSTSATMPLAITGYPPCPSGSTQQPTPYLSMVWQVPVAGGPLAIQPPDIQIVEAAVMQTDGS